MIWGKGDRFGSRKKDDVPSYYIQSDLLKKSHNRLAQPSRPPFSPSSSSLSRSSLRQTSHRSIGARTGPTSYDLGDAAYDTYVATTPTTRGIKGLRPGSALEGGSLVSLGMEESALLDHGPESPNSTHSRGRSPTLPSTRRVGNALYVQGGKYEGNHKTTSAERADVRNTTFHTLTLYPRPPPMYFIVSRHSIPG
jgi:hypothetical protein